jgi:hypothetical protein
LTPHETSTFGRRRLRRMAITFTVVVVIGVLVAPLGATALLVHRSPTMAHEINVTPPPGRTVAPDSQIAFRGGPAHRLRVLVTGSSSGLHAGILRPDHDLLGATFVPDRPLTPGERLRVTARVAGADTPERTFDLTVDTRPSASSPATAEDHS